VIGFQIGLSMAQVYNPLEGEYSNPLGRLLNLTFLLVFLLIDGHHHILRALITSFEVVPLAGAQVGASASRARAKSARRTRIAPSSTRPSAARRGVNAGRAQAMTPAITSARATPAT
jgi:hypothetical protein